MVSSIEFSSEYLPGLASEAFVRPLTVADTTPCVAVESAFPEHERCSPEKFKYRLSECSDICLGLFIRPRDSQDTILIGHVIATRTSSPKVTGGTMEMPKDWPSPSSQAAESGEIIGNDSQGCYVAVHSLAILPAYQKRKLGRTLFSMYIEYIRREIGYAKSIIIIAHDHLLPFYKSLGFEDQGPSKCQFGGGGWYDMAIPLR